MPCIFPGGALVARGTLTSMLKGLDAFARAHHGVVSLADGPRTFQTSPKALSAHARRHEWERPWPGVVLVPGHPKTFQQACMVAIHAAGADRVLVARRSAAQLWDMRRRQHHTIELLVPWRQHDAELGALRLQLDGQDWSLRVKVRRTRTLWESHATSMDNLPITTPARTIIDLASVLPIDELRSVLIDARQRRIVTLAEVIDLHEFLRRYPGRAKLGRVLRDLDDADSRLEWEFRREAERRGFRPHPEHFAFRCSDGVRIEIDVAFPEAWVAVEIDGYGSHSERESLVTDHKRQNRAVLDGWRPFRVDWTRFKSDTDALFTELALLLKTPHNQSGPPDLAP